MLRRLGAAAALLFLGLFAGSPPLFGAPGPPRLLAVTVVGTDFRAAFSDGRVLRGADLVGATLDYARPGGGLIGVQIAAAFADPRDPTGEVWLFDLRVPDADGKPVPFCEPDPDGRRLAMPIATADGTGFRLTCTGAGWADRGGRL